MAKIKSESEIQALVKDCAEGQEDKLKQFFEIYSQDIYNFPIKIFHLDRDSASDFYLYAFDRLRTGKRFRSFSGKSSFKTWFYSVLRNLVIDWMRTVKVLPTVSLRKVDSEGREYRNIESEPDSNENSLKEEMLLIDEFNQNFVDLKIESRVIFKLSFIYYVNLNADEIQYIAEKSEQSSQNVIDSILELKDQLCDRNAQFREMEDKLTSLYQNILELKLKRRKIRDGNPNFDKGTTIDMADSNTALQIEKIEATLEKKYIQREKLLEKKEKGQGLVRTPYKYISEMLGIPEGSLSVQLMRTIEKIRVTMQKNLD